jgi:hypothetical protein
MLNIYQNISININNNCSVSAWSSYLKHIIYLIAWIVQWNNDFKNSNHTPFPPIIHSMTDLVIFSIWNLRNQFPKEIMALVHTSIISQLTWEKFFWIYPTNTIRSPNYEVKLHFFGLFNKLWKSGGVRVQLTVLSHQMQDPLQNIVSFFTVFYCSN